MLIPAGIKPRQSIKKGTKTINSERNSSKNVRQKRPALYEVLEVRRKYPRIVLNIPIKLKKAKSIIEAIAYDISIDDLQIRCDRQTAIELHPSGKFIREGKGPSVDVMFELSVEDEIDLRKNKTPDLLSCCFIR